jgi:hypothetical protein
MGITKTLVIVQCLNVGTITAYSSDMQNKIWEYTTAPTTNYGMIVDTVNNKLWVRHGTTTVTRYAYSETALTLESTITFSTGNYGTCSMCVDPSGSLYSIDYGTAATMKVSKILIAGTTVLSTLTIPSCTNYSSNTYISSILFDKLLDKPIVVYAGTTSTTEYYPAYNYTVVEKNLSSSSSKGNFYDTHKNNIYHYNQGIHNYAYDYQSSNTALNPITNKIVTLFDQNSAGISLSLYMFDKEDPFYNLEVAVPTEKISTNIAESNATMVAGATSGNMYVISGGTPHRFIKLDPDGKQIINKTMSLSPYSYNMYGFNPIKEDFYFGTYLGSTITRYDSEGNYKGTSLPLLGDPRKIVVVPSINEVPVTATIPPNIVYPESMSATNDTTPTVVFKVNANKSGWVQQFRLVGDTSSVVIAGTPTDVYERTFDSWVNGVNYDANWYYSSDYVPGNNPDSTGTWTILGTGDGLQTGGTHIVNGIDGNAGTYYVKKTIPVGSELTGASTNTIWYFNVFSYSKY